MDKSVELTDPATELADLVEQLRPTKRMPTGLEAIAGIMVAQNDAIFVDLLAEAPRSAPRNFSRPGADQINESVGCSDPRSRFLSHSPTVARWRRRICDSGQTAAAHRADVAFRRTRKLYLHRSSDQIPTRRNPVLIQMQVG
ncbi:hypothetical protein H8B02_15220 [Bradyrhizobium sp. Pear77]|uniref:hypothetical protein n=1 Tax=Bradyrhizobium altum TaxID=1571202 RepID=UPI001E28F7F9|nr:hypothetical protein [Bradyrhizobium altum]MCC8954736.1 hypothetical protein [Bradyrhizobium altum]